jgi:hypothetical protein
MALLTATYADAAVRRRVDVRYEREDETKSRAVESEVTFLTGQELNEKTRSFRYRMFSTYALIWFGEHEVAIIEMKSFMLTPAGPFGADDFKSAFFLGTELNGDVPPRVESERRPVTVYATASRWSNVPS